MSKETREPFAQPSHSEGAVLLELRSWIQQFEGLTAGFTTRLGGVSQAPFATLNLAMHVQDDPTTVEANRRLVSEAIQMPFEGWTCAEQVHGHHVHVVTADERGRGRTSREDAIPDADALITQHANICLTSFYADCVPLLFVDPTTRTIGLAHAGWKGTAEQIAVRVVERMQAEFHCKPEHIHAAIGPSISKCCYEVDKRVITPMEVLLEKLPMEARHGLEYRDNGRAMIDLREINRQLLLKAGILPTHIECTTWCTGCHTDLFYSHRAEGGKTGRMASWIGWKKG